VNLGLVGVRNVILREARGEYIAWIDQDDLTLPNRLATEVAFLEAHRDYAVCGSWSRTLTEQPDGSFASNLERMPCAHEELRASMLFLNPIACNSVMMRVQAFADRGLVFEEEFGNSLDYDMWSRASDTMKLRNLPRALAAYRVHGSQTSQGAALERMNAHELQIQAELASRALGVEMTDAERHWHAAVTVFPVRIANADDLDEVATWFARLREANDERRAFDRRELDRALARQWTTAVLGAMSSGADRRAVAGKAFSGLRRIGLPAGPLVASASQGIARRASRRSSR